MKLKLLKNYILFFSFIFSIFLLTNSCYADAAMRINLINQDPNPAIPGQYLDLNFQIENLGDKAASDFSLEILSQFPFSFDPDEKPIKDLGSISSGRQGDDAVLTSFTVRVDPKALNGINKLKVRYRKSQTDPWTYQDFDVIVQSSSNTLTIDKVTTSPKVFSPGSEGKIKISLKNLGSNTLKDLSIKLLMANYDGTNYLSIVPISPLNSSSEKKVNYLNSNSEIVFTFNVVVKPDAKSGVYNLPVSISFLDTNNEKTQISDFIGIEIGAKPDLIVSIDKNDLINSDTKGKISLKIINKGIVDAKFVSVKILNNSDFKLLSSSENYIGEIDSDDYETVDFDLFIPKTDSKKIILPIRLTFNDENNRPYEETYNLILNLFSKEELKKYHLTEGKKLNYPLMIFLVVISLFFLRRFRHKKHKK